MKQARILVAPTVSSGLGVKAALADCKIADAGLEGAILRAELRGAAIPIPKLPDQDYKWPTADE